MESKKYKNLREFYPYYLSEHSNAVNKGLHFIGTLISILILVYLVGTKQFAKIPFILLIGYGFAWVGHFFFEKNRPATFKYPFFSFVCDFKMFFDLLRGRVKF